MMRKKTEDMPAYKLSTTGVRLVRANGVCLYSTPDRQWFYGASPSWVFTIVPELLGVRQGIANNMADGNSHGNRLILRADNVFEFQSIRSSGGGLYTYPLPLVAEVGKAYTFAIGSCYGLSTAATAVVIACNGVVLAKDIMGGWDSANVGQPCNYKLGCDSNGSTNLDFFEGIIFKPSFGQGSFNNFKAELFHWLQASGFGNGSNIEMLPIGSVVNYTSHLDLNNFSDGFLANWRRKGIVPNNWPDGFRFRFEPALITGQMKYGSADADEVFRDSVFQEMVFGKMQEYAKNTYTISTVLKDFIFEGCQGYIKGNKTGGIAQYDGTTDLPKTLNSTFDISLNKIGGFNDSNHVVVSTITNSLVTNFYMQNQTPVGKHELNWVQSVTMGEFLVHNSKLTKFTLTSAGSPISINWLNITPNPIQQTFAELFDVSKVVVKTLWAYGLSGLSGTIPAIPEGAMIWELYLNNLSGAIPAIPSSLTYFNGEGNQFTGYPSGWNNCAQVYLAGNQLAGTTVLVKQTDFRLCTMNSFVTNLRQTGSGTNIVDASGQVVNMNTLQVGGSKLQSLILPTGGGIKILNFSAQDNPDMALLTIPSTLEFTALGSFILHNSNQNQTFLLGDNIRSKDIHLYNNGISEPNVNATLDSWVDNQGNFAGSATLKTLKIGGTNAAVTNSGRATRIDEILQTVETGNWLLTTNQPTSKVYARINSFTNAVVDQIIVTLNSPPDWIVSDVLTISNTANINGSWTVVSRGTDAAATNNANGIYYKLTKAGFGSGTVSETGVITK